MSEPKCACRRFERLEGAAVQPYITQFLERTDTINRYKCRECAAIWKKVEQEDQKRPSLIKSQE
ncbi:MAG TPA: hypothetical protein VEF04_13840 [Blastocatellia bacterium]|nr:hypothetical protein [Blastocatellia bacterium]